MQGYLSIWSGFLSGWKQSYFILHNDVLTYCSDKGGQKQGSIHLKVASIIPILDDPLRICLHTGTSVIQLRAPTVDTRVEWVRVLGQAQSESINHEVSLQMREMEAANGFQNFEQQEKKTRALEAITSELWKSQAELEELLSQILVKMRGSSTATLMCDKLSKLTHKIKYKTNQAVQLLQSYQTNMRLSHKIRNSAAPLGNSGVFMRNPSIRQNSSLEQYKSFSKDQFKQFSKQKLHSFNNSSMNDYRSIPNNDEFKDFPPQSYNPPQQQQFESFRLPQNMRQNIDSINDYQSFADPLQMVSYGTIDGGPILRRDSDRSGFRSFDAGTPRKNNVLASTTHLASAVAKCSHPYKSYLIANNPVWSQITGGTLPNDLVRLQMPISVKQEEINILSVLKGLIGQDLTRISLPVIINEPLSILQKGCEQMYYSNLLDQANSDASPARRLLFVIAFNISSYSLSVGRIKKPFNPLLGQTFQYIDPQRKFMFLSQQVSHHPPISAFHCESQHYQLICNSSATSSFRGSCIQLTPLAGFRVYLKRTRQNITFNRLKSSLNNLVFGTKYVDNYGEAEYKMWSPEGKKIAEATVKFTQCGMFGGNQYEMEGKIRDDAGVERYVLTGKWNQELVALDKYSGRKEVVWSMAHGKEENYYNYNELSMNLNFLNKDLFDSIAPTDTRLRPDQKALEYDLKDLAASQKDRLQNKQRSRRKENQQRNTNHSILWFDKTTNSLTGETEWISNKQYWAQRKQKAWKRCLELF